ncbi:MAG: sigma-70 family RNA polymerase sigma factor [Planctomycetaceae bacterium]|nr:sigma-70 family RNA polymerase sigma factor [Planctomycetaceae bacterium]
MTEIPDTRESLLMRIGDPADVEAWQEFAEIYRPAAYRMARRRGLQDADADDLAQRVLVAISEKIAQWRPTSPSGSFRAWLSVVARNLIVNAITRRRPDFAKGGSSVIERLGNHPERDTTQVEFDEEYRRALFRLASEQIQHEFQESTWQAFWLTAVEGVSTAAAAERLDKSQGVIYAGRSRVMRRLKEKVRELEAEQEATIE